MKPKNSNCGKIQKLKLRWNSKTQMGTKLKTQNVTKLKKTQIETKLKNSNCDKTHAVTKLKLWQN